MKVLWEAGDALSASEIAERIPNRNLPATSIQRIPHNLEKKNAIRVDAITKLGKSYRRLFRPTLSVNEYAVMQFGRYYQSGKSDCVSIVSSLLENTSANKYDKKEWTTAITIFSLAIAVVWVSILAKLISLFRKQMAVLRFFSIYPLSIVLLFCILRIYHLRGWRTAWHFYPRNGTLQI